MLRNLSAGNFTAKDTAVTLLSYLRNLRENPTRLIALSAIFIIPAAALSWWYYAVAMSVSAALPLNATPESQQEIIITNPQPISEAPNEDSTPVSSSSAVSSERIDIQLDSSTPENNVVEVDGQTIPVPVDGSTHQVIQNDNGKTTIDINVDSDTSGSSKVRSSTNINLRSSSDLDVDIESEEVQ